MPLSINRRHALVGISSALVGATILAGCGGGGGNEPGPSDPSTPSTPTGGMAGSIWYTNINSDFSPNAGTIIGLTILDIADPNNIGVIRSDFLRGDDAVVWFAWIDGDRFVYVDKNRNIISGTAGGSPSSDRVIGRMDTPGLLSTGWDVHPDGNSMLVTAMSLDASAWDIYLHDTSGRQLNRVTTSGKAYAPEWSPDGRHFMFKWGNAEGCGAIGGCAGGPSSTCTGFYAPAGSQNLAYESAQQRDGLKVPCLSELYWSSIP